MYSRNVCQNPIPDFRLWWALLGIHIWLDFLMRHNRKKLNVYSPKKLLLNSWNDFFRILIMLFFVHNFNAFYRTHKWWGKFTHRLIFGWYFRTIELIRTPSMMLCWMTVDENDRVQDGVPKKVTGYKHTLIIWIARTKAAGCFSKKSKV